MSLDINFNKSISKQEIEEKTSLKVEEKDGSKFLVDQYGNVVFFKGYGITLYGGPRNPLKILDELIKTFDIMFIDDSAIDKLDYESDKYKPEDLFWETMDEYGYVTDGKIVIPEREEKDYLPFATKESRRIEGEDELLF